MKRVYLLDTNVVSEFSKERPDANVLAFYGLRKELCAISAITWQELERGVHRMPEGKKKHYLERVMATYTACLEIIPYDRLAAGVCGELQARAEQDGRSLPYSDSQIAATAIVNGMVLVTRNTADFEPMREYSPLQLENWFSA